MTGIATKGPDNVDDGQRQLPRRRRLAIRLHGRSTPTANPAGKRHLRQEELRRRKARRRQTFRTGAASALRLLLAPLGARAAGYHKSLNHAQRLQQGLVILLPGIDGCTTVSDSIARGIGASDCDAAVEIHDWRSFRGWNPFHLVTAERNRVRAAEICQRILDYQLDYPGRPVHLIGHSAGAGMALFVLQELPVGVQIESAVLLAAAISRTFDVGQLVSSTRCGIWNFWSRGDLPTVGLGTLIFGTMDRRHSASAGALGFRQQRPSVSMIADSHVATNDEWSSWPNARPVDTEPGNTESVAAKLHDVGYEYAMAKCWNFGGHFGCTNTAFVSRYVTPILTGRVRSKVELLQSG